MIIQKENVVRYIVDIDSEKIFHNIGDEAKYLLDQFIRDGMESEVEKMRKKGWTYRVIEENSYYKRYAVEYRTRISY